MEKYAHPKSAMATSAAESAGISSAKRSCVCNLGRECAGEVRELESRRIVCRTLEQSCEVETDQAGLLQPAGWTADLRAGHQLAAGARDRQVRFACASALVLVDKQRGKGHGQGRGRRQ